MQTETNYDKYEYVHYIYETAEAGPFESTTMIEGIEFASVKCLKKEIDRLLLMGYSEDEKEREDASYDHVKGRNTGGVVICKEGAFYWDVFENEYERVGEFHRENTHRLKRIQITEDTTALFEREAVVLEKGHYTVVGERKEKVAGTNFEIELFSIKNSDGEIITVPNNSGVFKVYDIDFALIDYPA